MKPPRRSFKVGARGSRLSLAQTEGAVEFLARQFPGTRYRVVAVETPGDRDLVTPIERSAPDFFTRDLDEAVAAGRIDFAVHSAKDMPETVAEGLDWFWLPTHEDPRDCWVVRPEMDFSLLSSATMRVGISSERRSAYAKHCFPKAKLLPIRGAIDSRIQQLLDGKFDAVLMAMAGINRLYPKAEDRKFTMLPIPLDQLEPPEAQGWLAIVFRRDDPVLTRMRQRFVKAVRFVSAGVGDAGLCTLAGARDLSLAEVVLYDDLMGPSLLAHCNPQAKLIHVGKRCGAHSMKQPEITRLLCDEVRKGRRVVRLKGGDAGLFGRLAEETEALSALKLPFLVRPGVSALTAATTGTGMLLTRRGESAGFGVYTPRRAADGGSGKDAAERSLVMFMASKVAADESRRLLREGWNRATPCAMVWDAAGAHEAVETSTIGELARGGLTERTEPGLFVVGPAASHRWPADGEFGGCRVLVTCSEAVQEKAATAVEDRGGRPLRWPLIRLVPRPVTFDASTYDAVVLTSPSAVRIFFEVCDVDRRRLPSFFTCGAGTDAELRRYGVASDLVPSVDFSAKGLIAEISQLDLRDLKVLRLRSAKAGPAVARALRRVGATVDDRVLYDNEFLRPEDGLPPFDDVFFASASAVESFLAGYGEAKLRGRGIYVMGEPTRAALPERLRARAVTFAVQ